MLVPGGRGPSKIKRGQSCISLVPILCQGFPGSLVGKESTCNAGEPGLIPGLGRSTGEGILLHSQVFLGFPCGSAGKESACNVEDLSLIPGLERSLGEGKGYPLQYSGLYREFHDLYSPWGCKESDMNE